MSGDSPPILVRAAFLVGIVMRVSRGNLGCGESVPNPVSSLDLLSKNADCHYDYKREHDSRRQNV